MRTLIVGLDAFDPALFERLSEEGRLPHLARSADEGRYARFGVANPPQSEVSWTSIATGLNPGGHGIFDFVHRDPATYTLSLSLLPTKKTLVGTQFVPPYTAPTIFDQAARRGYPATALWWPATFPARPDSPVRTLPGLGTPDIQGRLGVGTWFVADPDVGQGDRKTKVAVLEQTGRDHYRGRLFGPARKTRGGNRESSVELTLEWTGERSARLTVGGEAVELVEGRWSPIFEVTFSVGRFVKLHSLTRAILNRGEPGLSLYLLPLQVHPLHSPWPYGTPGSFVRETWRQCGPFLTVGWPQETTALEEGCITDDQFLALCETIERTRERILLHHLERFDEGILGAVFDSLDRVQHMFWRERPDIVEQWYARLDAMVGRIEQKLGHAGRGQTRLLVVSDHGFSGFDQKVHLNRWLVERGYLVPRSENEEGSLGDVDWSRTQAYALGLNSIYLNREGREREGRLSPEQARQVVADLREALAGWRSAEGRRVVQEALSGEEAFDGPLSADGPDLLVGFAPSFRASAETGLGRWKREALEPNRDHWSGDHCFNARTVPGVLFSSESLAGYPQPAYRDFPALAIDGAPDAGRSAPPPRSSGDEDQAVIEERLRSLGYL